mgnify:CR=1 FL=1
MGFAIFLIIFLIIIMVVCFGSSLHFQREIEQQKKQETEKFNREHPHYKEESFYRECVKLGILNAEERANIARISAGEVKK